MHVTNWGKYYPQNFGGMDSLYKSHIFLTDDEFLPYSMPEVFNETGHGFIAERSIHILSTTLELKALSPPWLRALSKFYL